MSTPLTDSFISGYRYHGFLVEKAREIPELQCRLIELHHIQSHARVIHIQSDDTENLFCISFQTLPYSSNGIAHVLEHLVLCGSEKFPVKDPFFSMTRRSLNTFMNALTGTDFTCYPAASQIEQDFYNLLDVYLDAAFHPLLNQNSFLQEAHRLEFTSPEDPSSELTRNGVVYNEMKGANAQPIRRLMKEMHRLLFKDLPYSHDSGGDPREIPSLTLEDLKKFHKKFYHPSRALFFFYGSFPLANHLDFLEDRLLANTDPLPPLTPIPQQLRFSAPQFSTISYPVTDEKDHPTSYLAIGWLTTHLQNQVEVLALTLLDIMLMETDASPLKYRLLQSGKCHQVISTADFEITEVPYILIMTGVQESNRPALTTYLFESIHAIAEAGFSKEQIEHAFHQLEFAKSEIHGGHPPFGLTLYARAALLAHHMIDPIQGLVIHTLFDELRETLREHPRYFSELLQKYFLDNTHCVHVLMNPSASIQQQEIEEEKAYLHTKQTSLSQEEASRIIQQKKELTESPEIDLSCLPSLHLSDIPTSCRHLALTKIEHQNLSCFHHKTFTNGIDYLTLQSPLPYISPEDLWLVRIFALILPQVGSANRTYQEHLEYIQAYTGGIYTSLRFHPQTHNPEAMTPSFLIKGKALHRHLDRLTSLLIDMLLTPRFDETSRIKEILTKHMTDLEHSIVQHAMEYATLQATAPLSISATISEEWYGISYFRKLRTLMKDYDHKESWLIEKLHALKEQILLHKQLDCILCGENILSTMQEHNFWGLQELPLHHQKNWQSPSPIIEHNTGFIIPSHVAYTSLAQKTTAYIDPDTAILCVAGQLLEDTLLHKQLREQGGAYGGGISINPMTGIATFYSYKDPNVHATFKAYETSIRLLKTQRIDHKQLEEAKLGVLQDLDAPLSPSSRGDTAYSWWKQGKTEAIRQQFRTHVLQTSPEEIERVLHRFFPEGWSDHPFIALGEQHLLEKNAQQFQEQGRTFEIRHL